MEWFLVLLTLMGNAMVYSKAYGIEWSGGAMNDFCVVVIKLWSHVSR